MSEYCEEEEAAAEEACFEAPAETASAPEGASDDAPVDYGPWADAGAEDEATAPAGGEGPVEGPWAEGPRPPVGPDLSTEFGYQDDFDGYGSREFLHGKVTHTDEQLAGQFAAAKGDNGFMEL